MIIDVTEDDIKQGFSGSSGWCPVAIALRRKFPDASYVNVGDETFVVVTTSNRTISDWLPSNVMDFVHAFDSGLAVFPITFSIKLSS